MSEWIQHSIGISPDVQYKIVTSVAIIFIVAILRFILLRLFVSKLSNLNQRYQWRKFSLYVAVILMPLPGPYVPSPVLEVKD